MAKYFSGITLNGNKYKISIIDDNLNIIFLDNLEFDKLIDLLKRKSVSVISVDAPLAVYAKCSQISDNTGSRIVKIKRRSFESNLISNNLLTFHDRYNVGREKLESLVGLYRELNKLGFSIKKTGETEKAIIESYADTSLSVLGFASGPKGPSDEIIKRKIEFLKSKGIRIKDYLKRNKKDIEIEINTLYQAYASFLYNKGECTCFGSEEEGLLVLPSKNIQVNMKPAPSLQKVGRPAAILNKQPDLKPQSEAVKLENNNIVNKQKSGNVIAEYCGAQYLYTNTDGNIRISDLRPIKSYRPFTEIYEVRHIRQVQVIIGTTDGLRKVKANLIPSLENSNNLRAADDEDKRKLDSFWGNNGDKRGYLIKFNRVEVVKA